MHSQFQLLAIVLVVKIFCVELSLQLENNEYEKESIYYFQRPDFARDCEEIFEQCQGQTSSGIYMIKPDGYREAFEVYCENDIDTGRWTVFQRRNNGNIDFQRNWTEYKNGFGFLNNDFWLGNEKLSFLTNQKEYEIRIEMENVEGRLFYVSYDLFSISDEWSDYKLVNLGQYSGTANSFVTDCPDNMLYGNCTCQNTCEDPDMRNGCHGTCGELEMCYCPKGFFIKGHQCVPAEECACFQPGEGVIASTGYTYNPGCTRRCSCEAGVVTCEDNFSCDVNAVCEERENIRKCYCNEEFIGDGNSCAGPMTDCQDIFDAGYTDSSVYTIKPTDWPGSSFEVYCNMTDGRGWTVIQRRIDGLQDFYQNWITYKQGFGSSGNELWLGNEKLYFLTKQKSYQLRIDITLSDGTLYHLEYDLFRIGDEISKYQLTLGNYWGNAGYDYMDFHRGYPFSTFDRDNDPWSESCAITNRGGWWYSTCYTANLNGHYDNGLCLHHGVIYNFLCHLQYEQMKIRPL